MKPLNEIMEFDHIVTVNEDGTVTDSDRNDYFDLRVYKGDDDQWHDSLELPEGWSLMNGYSGQYGYSGPIMHPSEYIGGGMERDILEAPGHYVALTVEADCGYTEEFCTEDAGCDCFPAGWAVAYRPLD